MMSDDCTDMACHVPPPYDMPPPLLQSASMTNNLDSILAPYDYMLPQHLIATSPASPRDSAKLLVYNRASGKVTFDTFHNIAEYLPKNAVLVFNQTKVFPARFRVTKKTGGSIEALYIETVDGHLKVMASGKIAAGDVLTWEDGHSFIVFERDGKYALLTPSFALTDRKSVV